MIDREPGSIDRFPSPKHLASYSGLVPRVSASGGKVHFGRMITPSRRPSGKQANNYLKWAFRAAIRSAAERHRGRQCGRSAATTPQMAEQLRRPTLRANLPQERPCRGCRCRWLATWRKRPAGLSRRARPTGSQFLGIRWSRNHRSAQARPGSRLACVGRDPRAGPRAC